MDDTGLNLALQRSRGTGAVDMSGAECTGLWEGGEGGLGDTAEVPSLEAERRTTLLGDTGHLAEVAVSGRKRMHSFIFHFLF